MIKKSLCALVLTLGFMSSGCLGPNHALGKLNNWNASVTDQNWLNEVIFLVLSPIHVLAWTGDVLIFNTIDYWGDNPIGKPGDFPKSFSK